nr:G496 [uncultured bacterium]
MRHLPGLLALFATLLAGNAFAGTADEAALLKTTLTPLGAERSGNADGTIPAWSGGYQEQWPGYVSGGVRPDPFKDEKALFSIDKNNVGQYADKLTLVSHQLLMQYPGYRIDVYPTHRTAMAPDWVYENTAKNVTRARTEQGGLELANAYGGIAFPIPKNGYELMWNHLMRWRGVSTYETFRAYVVNRQGEKVLASDSDAWFEYPSYYPQGNPENSLGFVEFVMVVTQGPPFKAGEAFLILDPLNQVTDPRKAWQYLVGQRRTRRAPQIAFDTPDFVTSGVSNFDEAEAFNGSMERYDVKLVGKRELIIPYNTNHLQQQKIDDVLGPHWLNPDHLRWELHRVWVAELTLREGKRHVMSRRVMYLDEDTWMVVLSDEWDASNNLWRMSYQIPFIAADMPGIAARPFGALDLLGRAYTTATLLNELPVQMKFLPQPQPENFFTTNNLGRLVTR